MKDKVKKALIPIGILVVILIGIVVFFVVGGSSKTDGTGHTQSEFEKDPNATYLTRGEWIRELSKLAGMMSSETTAAYFADVNAGDELYSYVQSAADWGLFEKTGGDFDADADASREFIIATAVIAADVLEDYGYIKADEAVEYKTCIQFARDNGNIETTDKEFLAEPVTTEEGEEVLKWVRFVYENPVVNEREEIVLQDNVIDFRNETTEILMEENSVTFTGTAGATLQAGDVFLVPPTGDYPVSIARKVVAITKDGSGNTVVQTETPELGEIFETLSVEQIVGLKDAQIHLYDGFSFVGEEATAQNSQGYQLLSHRGGGGGGGHGKFKHKEDGGFLTKELSNKRYDGDPIHLAVKWSAKDGVVIKEEKLPNGWEVKITDPFQKGEDVEELLEGTNYVLEGGSIKDMMLAKRFDYEEDNITIAGALDVTDIYAIVDLDIQHGDLNFVNVKLNYDAEFQAEIVGEYRNEIPVADVIFPVAGVCAVEGKVYLYIDAEGKLGLKLYTGATAEFSYDERKGAAFIAIDREDEEIEENKHSEIELELTAESGLGLSAGLTVVSVDVLKMGVDIGAQVQYKPSLNTEIQTNVENDVLTETDILYLDLYGTLAYPVVTRYAEFDVVFVNWETKEQLRGPEGAWIKEEPAVLLDERHEIMRTIKQYDADGNELVSNFQEKFEEFVLAPENANLSFENLYSIDGVRAFVNKIGTPQNETCNVLGTKVYYTEEPRQYVDGRVEEGATITFSGEKTQEHPKSSYSSLEYTGTDLTKLTTNVLYTDEIIPEEIEGISGFSNYLRSNQCLTVKDILQSWDLGSEYISAAEAEEANYTGEMKTEKFGVVKIEVKSDVAMYGDLYSKTIRLIFKEGSSSPYERIFIQEGFPSNYLGEIKSLWITAYPWENE
ncbi:MAG: hypothetical protein IJA07_03510 [Agathobacter sp.]|nr:hypothetical protein [Agathobacter sp.]